MSIKASKPSRTGNKRKLSDNSLEFQNGENEINSDEEVIKNPDRELQTINISNVSAGRGQSIIQTKIEAAGVDSKN